MPLMEDRPATAAKATAPPPVLQAMDALQNTLTHHFAHVVNYASVMYRESGLRPEGAYRAAEHALHHYCRKPDLPPRKVNASASDKVLREVEWIKSTFASSGVHIAASAHARIGNQRVKGAILEVLRVLRERRYPPKDTAAEAPPLAPVTASATAPAAKSAAPITLDEAIASATAQATAAPPKRLTHRQAQRVLDQPNLPASEAMRVETDMLRGMVRRVRAGRAPAAKPAPAAARPAVKSAAAAKPAAPLALDEATATAQATAAPGTIRAAIEAEAQSGRSARVIARQVGCHYAYAARVLRELGHTEGKRLSADGKMMPARGGRKAPALGDDRRVASAAMSAALARCPAGYGVTIIVHRTSDDEIKSVTTSTLDDPDELAELLTAAVEGVRSQ